MTAWLGIHSGPQNTAAEGGKQLQDLLRSRTALGILLAAAGSSSGICFVTLCSRRKMQRRAFSHNGASPFPSIWQEQANTLPLTQRNLIISSFFPLFPRCTELNLIRCYITSVRGCMANLIRKKQCVSPSLADSFTSWHLWEKPPLRHILQPV